jgi:hypothetical protein
MGQVSLRKALCTTAITLLSGLLGALLVVPAAVAAGGNANYDYKITSSSYDASGELAGAKIADCVGIAFWQGKVTTEEADPDDLNDLSLGKASLNIHGNGSSGSIDARFRVKSTLGGAHHRITTECDEGLETKFVKTVCNDRPPAFNPLRGVIGIEGGVGNRVNLFWHFFIPGGGGFLVSNVFSCVEPLKFPGAGRGGDQCESSVGLNKLTARTVKLPFNCFYSTTTPPVRSSYSTYTSSARAHGYIMLKRTKQS